MGHRERGGTDCEATTATTTTTRMMMMTVTMKARKATAAAALFGMMVFAVAALRGVNAQETPQFAFGNMVTEVPDESTFTREVNPTCVSPPAQTPEELLAQEEVLQSQLQEYFFQFLPCALGGASNLQCCENIEALLGPYPDAALHNCLCLPGTFEALVAGSEGIGNQNVTEIVYGCAAREDFEFNTLFLDRCTNETVIIPEGYDPDLLAEQLGLGNTPLPPEEAFDEIQEQINQIIDSFRPPTPKP